MTVLQLNSYNADTPLRTLLYLQLILQMQSQLATDDSASSILNKPDHILSFIKHALESASPAPGPSKRESRGLHLEDLRIVEEAEDELEEGDSDDEELQMAPVRFRWRTPLKEILTLRWTASS